MPPALISGPGAPFVDIDDSEPMDIRDCTGTPRHVTLVQRLTPGLATGRRAPTVLFRSCSRLPDSARARVGHVASLIFLLPCRGRCTMTRRARIHTDGARLRRRESAARHWLRAADRRAPSGQGALALVVRPASRMQPELLLLLVDASRVSLMAGEDRGRRKDTNAASHARGRERAAPTSFARAEQVR